MRYYIFLCLFFSLCAFAPEKNDPLHTFILKGKIILPNISEIHISYIDAHSNTVYDSAAVQNSHFQLKGEIAAATLIHLYSKPQAGANDTLLSLHFYIEPQIIQLTIDGNDISKIKINESETKKDSIQLARSKIDISEKREILSSAFERIRAPLKESKDSAEIVKLKSSFDSLCSEDEKFRLSEIYIDLDFITAHPYSFLSLQLLHKRIYWHPEYPSVDSINSLFHSLSYMVQKSYEGNILDSLIQKALAIQVGKQAPSFDFETIHSVRMNTSSFLHSKAVLLDFWTSYCIPCRNEFPELKELYNKYKDDGFQVISISGDTDTSAWVNAIEKDGTGMWIHTLKNKLVFDTYLIPCYPMKYLINKEGIIVGRWRGGGPENMESLKETLAKIFPGR